MYKIVKKEFLNPITCLMEVEAPRVAKAAKPGQFLIVRATADGELNFEDAEDVSAWAKNNVVYAAKNGIMLGSNNCIRPKATITRAETFVLLDKCMNK